MVGMVFSRDWKEMMDMQWWEYWYDVADWEKYGANKAVQNRTCKNGWSILVKLLLMRNWKMLKIVIMSDERIKRLFILCPKIQVTKM